MNASQLRCSLCSRDYEHKDVRQSPNGVLCHACWSVICPQPWPKDDSAHGGNASSLHGGSRPDGLAVASAKAAAQEAAAAAHAAHRLTMQRRSVSMANMAGVAVPGRGGRPPVSRHPNSMPEHPGVLSGSADDPRWGLLGQAGSAPAWRQHSLGAAPEQPPTFSPVELKNMMDEQSLELFESQSHLLDPESRVALQRQRQYLEWHNSMEEPGPMQSVLERQDSAGSGCNDLSIHGGTAAMAAALGAAAAAAAGGAGEHVLPGSFGTRPGALGAAVAGGNGSGDTSSGGTAGSAQVLHELQEMRRHLAVVSREREGLVTRVHQLEAELQAQHESTLCKMCRSAPRNCVVLPCLHFTSCDGCFKKHCAATYSCPMCNQRVTGYQTLLML
ncbi:hypothetical protein Ndes2526B_g08782 [Nannochloris sp. 'desiccata']